MRVHQDAVTQIREGQTELMVRLGAGSEAARWKLQEGGRGSEERMKGPTQGIGRARERDERPGGRKYSER